MPYAGELSAVIAAFGFGVTSTLFTLSGRKIGPVAVNRISIPMSLLFLALVHWLVLGTPLPHHIALERWLWLSGSGVLGMWIAFLLITYAFVQIGPRLTLLITAISPIISAILAWLLLDQTLNASSISGMALTIGGIAWVIADNKTENTPSAAQAFKTGILFALGGATAQAISSIMSSQGVTGDFEPLTGSVIRLLSASVAIWTLAVLQGTSLDSFRLWRANPATRPQIVIGSISGPVMGASLLLISFQAIPVGIAMTLSNLTPIFLLPIGYFVFKEQISRQAILGTCLAVAGTAVLFLGS